MHSAPKVPRFSSVHLSPLSVHNFCCRFGAGPVMAAAVDYDDYWRLVHIDSPGPYTNHHKYI